MILLLTVIYNPLYIVNLFSAWSMIINWWKWLLSIRYAIIDIFDKINVQVCLWELKKCWTKARQKQLVLGLTNRCLIYKTRYTTVCSEMNKPQTLLLGGKFNRWKWNGGDSKSMPFWNKMVSKWGGMTKGKRNLPEGTSSILLHSHIAYVPDKYHLLRLLLSSGNSVWFWWYSNSRCWQGPS